MLKAKRRGLLLICAAIEAECKAGELGRAGAFFYMEWQLWKL